MPRRVTTDVTAAHIADAPDSIALAIRKQLRPGRSVAWVAADGSVVVTSESEAGMVPGSQVLGVFVENMPLYEIRLDVVEMQKYRARNRVGT
jgi:hypothetical protein